MSPFALDNIATGCKGISLVGGIAWPRSLSPAVGVERLMMTVGFGCVIAFKGFRRWPGGGGQSVVSILITPKLARHLCPAVLMDRLN